MARPPLEFGFSLAPLSRFASTDEAAEVARAAEAAGFDVCAIPEHLLTPRWPTAELHTKVWYDQATLMAFLAGRTTRLALMTSVLVVPYHPPVQTAKALVTADHVSQGRVRLGVGVGWMEAEFRRLGIPFHERGAITDEYLAAMRALWTEEDPSFEGRYVRFDDVSFLPKPVNGTIPIYVGGAGPAAFRRAARLGDGWIPMTASIDELRAGRADIERRMHEAGRDPSGLVVSYGVSMGLDEQTRAMRQHVDASGGRPAPARRRPDEAVERVAALVEAGVTQVLVTVPWRTGAELADGLEHFARDVIPAFRAR